MKIAVGFTGTRKGMSENQKKQLATVFRKAVENGDVIEFHHGDCIGSDAEADLIARNFGAEIHIHPPINQKNRAFCFQEGDVQYPEKTYSVRDRDIVNSVDIMIAAPKDETREEFRGSGTWSNYRYAKVRQSNVGKPKSVILLER